MMHSAPSQPTHGNKRSYLHFLLTRKVPSWVGASSSRAPARLNTACAPPAPRRHKRLIYSHHDKRRICCPPVYTVEEGKALASRKKAELNVSLWSWWMKFTDSLHSQVAEQGKIYPTSCEWRFLWILCAFLPVTSSAISGLIKAALMSDLFLLWDSLKFLTLCGDRLAKFSCCSIVFVFLLTTQSLRSATSDMKFRIYVSVFSLFIVSPNTTIIWADSHRKK